MATQTATTGQLENAQGIMLAAARYTAEHSAPCANLIEHMTLKKGDKQITVPKVGVMTMANLTDGVDLVDSEDIGMTTTDLTTGEAGLKVILTDKLLRQENENVFTMVGKQMGDAKARKVDTDIIALFAALNGSTTLGATTKNLTIGNAGACIAFAKANKFPSPVQIVHHPNAVYALTNSLAVSPVATYPVPKGYAEDLLRDFYKIKLNGIAIFEDGNIEVVPAATSGYGAIFSKSAMVFVESKAPTTERERDASLRAWEVVLTCDYGVFELDDSYGAPMRYTISAPTTST